MFTRAWTELVKHSIAVQDDFHWRSTVKTSFVRFMSGGKIMDSMKWNRDRPLLL